MTHPPHRLRVLNVALHVVDALGPVVRQIARRDRSLADQLKRAAQSMALNLAEAHGSQAGNRRARLETALGSTQESRAALRIAAAWGYIDHVRSRALDGQLDRVAAMTWRWLHRQA
ncbi:MAG: four helix bundle protein [Myxococcota bacterium]